MNIEVNDAECQTMSDAIAKMIDAALTISKRFSVRNPDINDAETVVTMGVLMAPWLVVQDLMDDQITEDERRAIWIVGNQMADALEQYLGDAFSALKTIGAVKH